MAEITVESAAQLKSATDAWATVEISKLTAQASFLKIQKLSSQRVSAPTVQQVSAKATTDLQNFLKAT